MLIANYNGWQTGDGGSGDDDGGGGGGSSGNISHILKSSECHIDAHLCVCVSHFRAG